MKSITYSIFLCLILPNLCVAQDLEHDRRIEALELEVAELRKTVAVLSSQLELIRMKLRERSSNQLLPRTKPKATSKSWVILVSANTKADTTEIERRIDQSTSRLKVLREQLEDTENSLRVYSGFDKSRSRSLERQARQQRSQVANEQGSIERGLREIENAKRNRTISGNTSDGDPVLIRANGAAAMIAKTMKVGDWYVVNGSGRVAGGLMQIVMRTASLTDPPED